VRAGGAVRRRRRGADGRHRRGDRRRLPGGGRQGRADQGPAGRGRRRPGLRDRRARRRRRRAGHRDRRGRGRRQRLPDRPADLLRRPRARPGVGRLRPLRGGGRGPGRRRVPPGLRGVRAAEAPSRRRTAAAVRRGRTPWALLLPALIGLAFLVLPFAGLLARTPWGDLVPLLSSPEVRGALWLSLSTATVATAVSLLFGVPLAWLIARTEFPGRRAVRALVTVPLVIPPVVGGVALLLVLGRNGLLGRHLYEWTGLSLPFSTAAVVVAQVFVAMPFLVISVDGALRG